MNKCIHFLVVLVMAGAASARADLLIYQYRTVNTAAGNSTEFTYSYRGYLIWDLASNHLSWVSYSVQGSTRRYSLTEGTPIVATVAGARGRNYTVFTGAGSSDGRYYQDFNRGQNVSLTHKTGQTIQFPRTFKGQSHTLLTGATPRVTDNLHVTVYSPARTKAANDTGQTTEDVVAGLQAELEAQGYTNQSPGAISQLGSIGVQTVILMPISIRPPPPPPATPPGP